jgi:PAS domain S-box-containing protein
VGKRAIPSRSPLQALNEELSARQLEVESANLELLAINDQIFRRSQRLEERTAFAGEVIEAVPVPLLVLDDRLRVQRAIRGFYTAFSVTPADLLGRPLARLPGWDAPELLHMLSGALGPRSGLAEAEFERHEPGGTARTIAASARRMRLPGQAPRLVCSLQDITESKHAQQVLESQLEQLGAQSAGLLVLDGRQGIQYVNLALLTMTGFRRADLLGHSPQEVMLAGREGAERRAGPMLAACRAGHAAGGEATFRRQDGGRFPARWSASPLPDGGTALEVHDLSAVRQVSQAWLESERLAASGKLAASLAHEINNPLGAIGNALFYLQQSASLEASARVMTDTAVAELQRVVRIVRNILGIYRDRRLPVALDANQGCEDALELVREQWSAKRLHVHRRLLASQAVELRSGELRQLLANLIGNAVEAAPAGGHLWVATRDSRVEGRNAVRLLIGDNGGGIAAAIRSQIFRPFFTTKGQRGTGLGLWVTAELARENQAPLRYHTSTRPPTGTCFALTFPASPSLTGASPRVAPGLVEGNRRDARQEP